MIWIHKKYGYTRPVYPKFPLWELQCKKKKKKRERKKKKRSVFPQIVYKCSPIDIILTINCTNKYRKYNKTNIYIAATFCKWKKKRKRRKKKKRKMGRWELVSLLPSGLKLSTFQSRVWCSTNNLYRCGRRIFFSRVNFLCWLIFSVCSTLCYHSGKLKTLVILPKMQAAGYNHTCITLDPTKFEWADYAVQA